MCIRDRRRRAGLFPRTVPYRLQMGRVWLPCSGPRLPPPTLPGSSGCREGSLASPVRPGERSCFPSPILYHSFSLNSFHIFKHRPFIKFSLISPFEGAIRSCWQLDCTQSRFPKALPCWRTTGLESSLLCVLGCGIDSKVIFLLWHLLPFLEI